MAQIPEKLINFRCYGSDTQEFLGMTDAELPAFDAMTETISGAGIAGEFESPVVGHFKPMALKLKFRTITAKAIVSLAPSIARQVIDVRGSISIQDQQSGLLTTQAIRVECSGPVKSGNLGKLEPGKVMGAEADIEVVTLRISVDGVLLVELDKLNQIYRVGGVDYLQQVRIDLGGV